MAAEAFPVCLMVSSRSIWIAWQLSDNSGDAILQFDTRPLWATTKSDLAAMLNRVFPQHQVMDSSSIDLDGMVSALNAGSAISAESLLNALNILDDFAKTAAAHGHDSEFQIIERRLDLYDKLFSNTASGDMLHVPDAPLRNDDYRMIADWISSGIDMVLSKTIRPIN